MDGKQHLYLNCEVYLLNLKSPDGVPLIKHPRKKFVLGFVMTIKSTLEMVNQILTLQNNQFRYVLAYKSSQDYIELLFSCVRTKGGWNNNLNSFQSKYAIRRMLLGNAVTILPSANCQMFDDQMVIPLFRTRKHESPLVTRSAEDGEQDNIIHKDFRICSKHLTLHCWFCCGKAHVALKESQTLLMHSQLDGTSCKTNTFRPQL